MVWTTGAQASELRFSQIAAGQVVATGNTLGLSKELQANGPGIQDSIGTFIALDPASVDNAPANAGNPWGPGTTNNWTMNGSDAALQLPAGAEVLHAELVWGGSTVYNTEDVTGNVDDSISLAFGVDEISVAPDPMTGLDVAEFAFSGFPANYYVRSADVTDFVALHADGVYTVSGVPATQDSLIDSLNAAGWTLLVAYRDSDEPIRNLTIFVGGSFVDEDSTEDYAVAGFCTPPSGPFAGRALVTTMEGDADLTGDSFQIAETAAGPFTILDAPNNPADNFFCSQINGPDGMLDIAGSFGAVNHDANAGLNVSGGRQGWDIAQVPVSSADNHFVNAQTEAVLRATTTGDSFVPAAVGFSIQVNAPDFSGDGTGAEGMPATVAIGGSATVTVNMENVGLVDATDLVFRAPLPGGLDLVSFSLDGNAGDIDGAAVDAGGLMSGVPIGDVAVGVAKQLVLELDVSGAPDGGETMFVIQPQWDYDYISCEGEDPLTEPHSTAPVFFDFDPGEGNPTTGAVDDTAGDSDSASASGSEGDGSASASASDGTASDGSTTFGAESDSSGTSEDSGCGCRTDGDRDLPAALWLLVAIPALRRRRR
jgi:uncharacterized repeat protein (TIGR01451 family)/MYXO-CTERM domain-containing protein